MRKGKNMRKKITPENWKLKVIKTDRNEVRVHVATSLVSVFYKNSAGLKAGYEFAKKNLTKNVAISIMNEYRKLKIQGA